MRLTWNHGDKTKVAKSAGIRHAYFLDLLAGRRGASAEMASRIETSAHQLGIGLSRFDLLYPRESRSPLMNVKRGGKGHA